MVCTDYEPWAGTTPVSNNRLPQSCNSLAQCRRCNTVMAREQLPPSPHATARRVRALRVSETSATAERDALYRDNQSHRERPVRLVPGSWMNPPRYRFLGLEQMTISRLYRAGIVRLEQLLETSVEELWRSIGRHGITDIIGRLEFQVFPCTP